MSSENTEILKDAVINLTVENAKLKKDVSKLKNDKEMYWKWYEGKKELLEKKESEVLDLRKEKESLQHYVDHTTGLWAFDKTPSEVDIDWIRSNAFQIEHHPKGLVKIGNGVVLNGTTHEEETE